MPIRLCSCDDGERHPTDRALGRYVPQLAHGGASGDTLEQDAWEIASVGRADGVDRIVRHGVGFCAFCKKSAPVAPRTQDGTRVFVPLEHSGDRPSTRTVTNYPSIAQGTKQEASPSTGL